MPAWTVRVRVLAATAIPVALVAACSLPTDERAVPINRDDLPPELVDTTTTTTTTTIAPVASSSPVSSVVDETAPTTATATTEAPAPTTPVELFYTVGFRDEVARLTRELQVGASLQQAIDQLETPLADVREFGLETSVRRGMVEDWSVVRGVATVMLDPDVVDGMLDANLGRAISQLVLTITSFQTGAGGIGRVRFEVDGEGFAVFVPADGGSSEPGEELAFEDFAVLIASDTGATTTTTTSTTTTEPPPPPSTAPPATDG